MIARIGVLPVFLALRLACALVLMRLGARLLPSAEFAALMQWLALAAVLNTLAVGAMQNGLIREAAAASVATVAAIQAAALAIWAAIAPGLLMVTLLAGAPLSRLLSGTSQPHLPAMLALLAILGGPGQIWCGVLSGRGRTVGSLGAQAIGVVAGTIAAATSIVAGNTAMAALGFAAGPAVTSLAARAGLHRAGLAMARPRLLPAEMQRLLTASGAIVATSLFSAGMLFMLRARYRTAFGSVPLSHWLAANRISDLTSQLLGLFMVQIVVPHFAVQRAAPGSRWLLLAGGLGASAAMLAGMAAFAALSPWVVPLVLSRDYLAAIPVIVAYLAGDAFRVWVSLAMNLEFAAGRTWRYAGIEITMTALLGGIVMLGIRDGAAGIVCWGYPVAAAIVAVCVAPLLLRPGAANAASTAATA